MIFGFLPQNLKTKAAAVAFSMAWRGSEVELRAGDAGRARGRLAAFRGELYRCLTARGDALFGLVDAVLCSDGPVRVLAGLSLVPGHRRGHGAVYDALSAGRVDVPRLRWAVGAVPLPAWPDGRIRLAVDVCAWLRPEARTSAERMFCHVHGRGKNAGQMIPGWPYSFVAALGPGASSWTAPLDAVRLGPDDDDTEVTAAQLREVAGRLASSGAWHEGDGDIIVVMDAGYDVIRLAWLLADLPVVLCARLRCNRVFYRVPAPKPPGMGGPPRQHGARLSCADEASWDRPWLTAAAGTPRARHRAGDRVGPGAPQAVQGRGLARSPGQGPRHRGHADPAPARPPAWVPRAEADVAAGRRHRRRRGRGCRAVAGLPAAL